MDNRGMVPIYFDTEFTGLHQNTTLISIGLISESGATFYAEFTDYDAGQVDDWVRENVIGNLLLTGDNTVNKYLSPWEKDNENPKTLQYNQAMIGDRHEIKKELIPWLYTESRASDHRKIQFYSDCLAYDWVLLNDLLCPDSATMLPDFLYYIPMDLSTLLQVSGVDPDIERESLLDATDLERINSSAMFLSKVIDCANVGKFNPKHNALWDAFVIKEIFHKNLKS